VKAQNKPGVLLPLVTKLKACPSQEDSLSQKGLIETWGCFKTISLEHGDTVTPAILVGVILYAEETFGRLLTQAERVQLVALGRVAQERYNRKTNPPNKLGKTIAAALKEQT